jgi:predicted transcriptional regulator
MTAKAKESKLGPFEFFGLDFSINGSGEAVGDCPFCFKEKHFHVNPDTGQWKCHAGACGEQGNTSSFLQKIYESAEKAKEGFDLKRLAKARNLPAEAFSPKLVKFGVRDGAFLFPVYNLEGKFAGVRSWDGKGPVMQPTPLHLLGVHSLPMAETVYIAEGDWDRFALDWLRSKAGASGAVLGAPGASTFKADWVESFRDRDIWLLYDNDEAGVKGMDRAIKMLSPVAKSIHRIRWPKKLKKGYDLNDFVSAHAKAPKKAWAELLKMCEEVTITRQASKAEGKPGPEKEKEAQPEKPLRVKGKPLSFDRLLAEYRKIYYLPKEMENSLAIMLAVVIASRWSGDPIWVFIVGPPSSGKTLMLRTVSHSEQCHYESTLRPHSLISGMELEDGSDPSLIPQLIHDGIDPSGKPNPDTGKLLIIKDYTWLMKQPWMTQEEIYSILRDAYDGLITCSYGNTVKRRTYEGTFGTLAGVTHIIHKESHASLGERFLKWEFIPHDYDREKHVREVLKLEQKHARHPQQFDKDRLRLQERLADFVEQDLPRLPTVPISLAERIIPLAQVIACLRATVDRDHKQDIRYRPQSEIGSRLCKQIIKTAQALAIVFRLRSVDERCYRIAEKLAFDTAYGFHLDIVRILVGYPKGVTIDELTGEMGIPHSSLQRKLGDLVELKIAFRSRQEHKPKSKFEKPGQPAFVYSLSPPLLSLWKRAKAKVHKVSK